MKSRVRWPHPQRDNPREIKNLPTILGDFLFRSGSCEAWPCERYMRVCVGGESPRRDVVRKSHHRPRGPHVRSCKLLASIRNSRTGRLLRVGRVVEAVNDTKTPSRFHRCSWNEQDATERESHDTIESAAECRFDRVVVGCEVRVVLRASRDLACARLSLSPASQPPSSSQPQPFSSAPRPESASELERLERPPLLRDPRMRETGR